MKEERTKKKLQNVNYTEPEKQKQKFTRNEGKYEKSYQEYESQNKDCFDTMI